MTHWRLNRHPRYEYAGNVGCKVKFLREKSGLSLNQLSAVDCISIDYLWRIEKNMHGILELRNFTQLPVQLFLKHSIIFCKNKT